jgi:hypothetical protein
MTSANQVFADDSQVIKHCKELQNWMRIGTQIS